MVKTFLIVFLVIAILLVGGGSFYYFEIYQPRTYVASLLALYQQLEDVGLQPNTSSLKDAADYAGGLAVLEKRIAVLESIQNELTRIHAPKRMTHIKKEFADYLDFTHAQHAHATSLTTFVKGASELQDAIKDVSGGVVSEENKIVTIGDLQKFWGERIPKTKIIAEKLFSEELTEFANPSFAELKMLWEKTSPAFDMVLKKVKIVNQNLAINQIDNFFTPSETAQLNTYSQNLEEFIKQLGILIKRYSAYDLLTFRYFPDVSSTESSNRALTFYQMIQKLKGGYVQ